MLLNLASFASFWYTTDPGSTQQRRCRTTPIKGANLSEPYECSFSSLYRTARAGPLVAHFSNIDHSSELLACAHVVHSTPLSRDSSIVRLLSRSRLPDSLRRHSSHRRSNLPPARRTPTLGAHIMPTPASPTFQTKPRPSAIARHPILTIDPHLTRPVGTANSFTLMPQHDR